ETKGQLFESLIEHPAVIAKRRVGLLMAVEFKDFDQNKRIIDRCIEKGVLTDWFLFSANSMRIAPPLIITEAQIRHACAVINEAIEEVA
ncbi:MAG: aminotransferase class III-fold pyridoxal phosphate-dependent enzyme, partial [Bacteroidetes bacterium]|nr:aminotransferase class III-fold pyridoxal phosphate-dependent enzyme [Bacteroidota bacterium]